jgi:hypothetical protein
VICGDCIASFMAFYLPWPGGLQAIVPPRGILKSLEQRADERTRTAFLLITSENRHPMGKATASYLCEIV